jgi:hypothetical protein
VYLSSQIHQQPNAAIKSLIKEEQYEVNNQSGKRAAATYSKRIVNQRAQSGAVIPEAAQ